MRSLIAIPLALALGQTFLGDVFKPGERTSAGFPTPSVVNRGGILFDGDAGTLNYQIASDWRVIAYQGMPAFGVGTTTPGQAIHIANGNFLVDGVGENAYIMKRTGTVGLRTDPIFQFGRIVAGGVNEPMYRFMYSDAVQSERVVYIVESTGTNAGINDDSRRAQFEAYIQDGSEHPSFRMNSYPDMSMELGSGGSRANIGAMSRSGSTVTFNSNTPHKLGVGQTVTLQPGEADFPQGTYTITNVVDADTVQWTSAGAAVSSTVAEHISAEPDFTLRRDGYNTGTLVMGGVENWRATDTYLDLKQTLMLEADAGTPGQVLTTNGYGGKPYWSTPSGGGGGGSGNFCEVSIALTSAGLAFSQAVTGQTWVTGTSKILCQPQATTADGLTIETYTVAGLEAVVGSLVAGTGFTLYVANPRGASGTFRFSCTGG